MLMKGILPYVAVSMFNLMSSSKVFMVAFLINQHTINPYLISLANPTTRANVWTRLQNPHVYIEKAIAHHPFLNVVMSCRHVVGLRRLLSPVEICEISTTNVNPHLTRSHCAPMCNVVLRLLYQSIWGFNQIPASLGFQFSSHFL